MLGNALANAVMLAFTYGGQVAQTFVGGLVEYLNLTKCFLSLACQFSLLTGFPQRTHHAFVVILADEPARPVTAVVGEIERHITLGCLRVLEVGQLTVVVQVVGTCQPRILLDLFACCLCKAANG